MGVGEEEENSGKKTAVEQGGGEGGKAKISPVLSSLLDGENFSNDALPPPEVKFTPQNLQLTIHGLKIFSQCSLL